MHAGDWRARGSYHDLNGHSVFAVATDTNAEVDHHKPTLVLLHGYPTAQLSEYSEYTYRALAGPGRSSAFPEFHRPTGHPHHLHRPPGRDPLLRYLFRLDLSAEDLHS